MSGLLKIEDVPRCYAEIEAEVSKLVVGQKEVVRFIFQTLLCKGHAILEGVPGLAKTTLIQSFAKTLNLDFNRIQFTPDLMPSDITGVELLQEDKATGTKHFHFKNGPVFTNILLADEINRTPPKTQAALLQSMQENEITVFGDTKKIDPPFVVLATQNPIEQEGTYPLPEAQLDRFIFFIHMKYPSNSEELEIVKMQTRINPLNIKAILDREKILGLQKLLLQMDVSEHIYNYVVKIIRASRPGPDNNNDLINKYVKWGAGPRATSFLLSAAKSHALIEGRFTPTIEDVKKMAFAVLNHRILLNYSAEVEKIRKTDIIMELLKNN